MNFAKNKSLKANRSTSKKWMVGGIFFLVTFAVTANIFCQNISEAAETQTLSSAEREVGRIGATAVCPPFQLRDENGEIINVTQDVNSDKPYSPKQTCGAQGCHNYAKITEGFHFQAGRDEALTDELARRYDWVTTPGYYGGRW